MSCEEACRKCSECEEYCFEEDDWDEDYCEDELECEEEEQYCMECEDWCENCEACEFAETIDEDIHYMEELGIVEDENEEME